MSMLLYTFPPAPSPRRIHLLLAAKGAELPMETVDLGAAEQLQPAYREINPRCTVPALKLDDGTVLTEVLAIADYLNATLPGPSLFGANDLERAQVLGWCHRLFAEGMMSVAEMLRNRGDAFKNRALPGPVDLEQIPELVERGRLKLLALLPDMNAHIRGRDYFVGDAVSMADIDALVILEFIGWVKLAIPDDCEDLIRWKAEMSTKLG